MINNIKKYNLEILLFIIDAIYMILELIASRLLSPYFGNSNLVWTSIIGIILLSNSIGNWLGGIIADKSKEKNINSNMKIILGAIAVVILIIPLIQIGVLKEIVQITSSIKIGAIIGTIILFFIPSMLIGLISPIIIKLKMNNLEKAGKTSGRIYAIATIGSLTGTFLGGFLLIPNFGSNQILFVLSIIVFLLIFIVEGIKIKRDKNEIAFIIIGIIICITCFIHFTNQNNINAIAVLNGEFGKTVSYDTQYGKVNIYNVENGADSYRSLMVDKGHESATFISEEKCYELVSQYTKYYDLMFDANIEINDALMIGGAGYSYPKYYISNYPEKRMDVVEIDGEITELAKEYFYLDKLIKEYNLENNNRLGLIENDGRVYLNQNTKKYDAILNDAFSGESPAKTLTTLEAINLIHDSLNEKGVYLTNIISSIDGENSHFIKAEVNTLKQVFKNVYVIPCNYIDNKEINQNNMVIATDDNLKIDGCIELNIPEKVIILTDNYCPVDTLIPQV